MVEKKIALTDRAWHELQRRYVQKWRRHVRDLIEKDLFARAECANCGKKVSKCHRQRRR